MVKWSCTKERIYERGPHSFVEWLRGLQLHGIGSIRLVYKKVLEIRSTYISYKKSYSGDLGIPLAVIQLGVTTLKKAGTGICSPRVV